MGVQMFEILEGEKHSQVLWQGKVINFAYDPNKYTAQAEAEWQRIGTSAWPGEMACAFIKKLLISWDLMGDVEFDMREPTPEELDEDPEAEPMPIPGTGRVVMADHAFPLEVVKLRYIPTELIGEFVERIQKDVEVGKAKRQSSSDGSSTAGMPRIRRIT